ncbi:hypothetical protein LSAT2_001856 [Lamellibrachia satsuma]|nr:hypothetical protein LSAT2_001856 [Lamellibrachia satsuma]
MAYVSTTPMTGANPNVVVVPVQSGVYSNYANKTSIVLGLTQIGVGIAIIITLVVFYASILGDGYFYVAGGSTPYYIGGAFYMLPGIFGIAAGVSKTKCPIVAFMVLSIFASIFGVLSFIGWVARVKWIEDWKSAYGTTTLINKVAAVIYTLVVVFAIESIASIWSYIICCRAVCCGASDSSTVVVSQAYPQTQIPMGGPNAYPSHYNSGYGAGPNAGYGAGPSAGYGAGPNAGYGAGPNAGYGAGPSAGYGAGPNAGYGAGSNAGYGNAAPEEDSYQKKRKSHHSSRSRHDHYDAKRY